MGVQDAGGQSFLLEWSPDDDEPDRDVRFPAGWRRSSPKDLCRLLEIASVE